MEALLGIGSAFGLSTSAGLNAYIPMLMVSILGRLGWLDLSEPFNIMESWWVITILSVLLVIEVFVDKIPAVDTVNDVVQTLVRPAAGALMFASQANIITDVNPLIAIVLGIMLAGGVHATKATIRPLVTTASVGTGNWVVSILEDVVAFFVSLMAILVPLFAVICMVVFFVLVFRTYRKRQNKVNFN
ncbi:MAG: putative membrane protein [Cellvibrionaceae bacterium]|jgi:uncharacterized membrane protein